MTDLNEKLKIKIETIKASFYDGAFYIIGIFKGFHPPKKVNPTGNLKRRDELL